MDITCEMIDRLNLRVRWLHQARTTGREPVGIKTGEKEMTAPTAREQFVQDFTLVVDNNFEAYTDTINSLTPSLVDNAERIKEGYEVAISHALDVLRQNKNIEEVTIDIMAQMLQGWGSDAFDDIARHYMEKE
jgi:hypothetical protein